MKDFSASSNIKSRMFREMVAIQNVDSSQKERFQNKLLLLATKA